MAEMDFDAFEASESPATAGLMSRAMNYVGAGSSVALVIGLAIWGYQLTVRDVTDVPVIRALEGPSRTQPENPGGQLAEHQGLAVNNLQAAGEAEGPTAQIILAPEPIDLTEEDVLLNQSAQSELAQSEPTVAETTVALTTETPPQTAPLSEAELTAQATALAERLADGIEPLEAPSIDETDAVEVAVAQALNSVSLGIDPAIPGVKRSPRPGTRPKLNLAAVASPVTVAATATASVTATNPEDLSTAATAASPVLSAIDVDPASITAGTRLVQLGAFDDIAAAQAEWDKISARFSDYIDGKSRLIQEASSGGRNFYRLRAVGFDDLNASRRFCAVLVAADAACIPVLAR